MKRARPKPIIATAVRFPPELHRRAQREAAARDLSLNLLVCRAVEDYLDRLIPVEEIRWTRD